MSVEVEIQPAEGSGTREELSLKTCLIVFLALGFGLRMLLVLWARTYVGSAETMRPFGAEVCRLASHIAAGEGFRAPFHAGDSGPSAWVAPVYPYLVAAIPQAKYRYVIEPEMLLLSVYLASLAWGEVRR